MGIPGNTARNSGKYGGFKFFYSLSMRWRDKFVQLQVKRLANTSCRTKFTFKCINGLIDFDFKLTTNNNIHSHNTRTSKHLHLPKANTNWGKQKPTYQASNDLNNLDNTIKNHDSLPKFKTFLKKLTVKNCIERN